MDTMKIETPQPVQPDSPQRKAAPPYVYPCADCSAPVELYAPIEPASVAVCDACQDRIVASEEFERFKRKAVPGIGEASYLCGICGQGATEENFLVICRCARCGETQEAERVAALRKALETLRDIQGRAQLIREDKAVVGVEAFYIHRIAKAAAEKIEADLPPLIQHEDQLPTLMTEEEYSAQL